MKVIIPVAGAGTRLRPHTHTQPKVLVPVAGKPILGHIIDYLIEGGITDFVFILGYLGDKIEEFVINNYQHKINIDCIEQEPREGSAHAIWVAKDVLKEEEEFLIFFGDSIVNLDLKKIIEAENTSVGVKKVNNPVRFGIAEANHETLQVLKVIEKPKIPKSNLALVGVYKIKNTSLFFETLAQLLDKNIKTNNEYQLTDVLMMLIEKGHFIQAIHVDNWFDCGRKETLLEANAILLNNAKNKNPIQHQFKHTILIPPVSIGENCKIENSIIGPNVAIGENSVLKNTIVTHSIIGAYSALEDVILTASVIGNDTSLTGLVQSLNVGDDTELNFTKS
ncbi:MAG: glucose-1-phosphate thymidylyltransferase [Bacteroidetes bacterium]|nr:MAG: glucose-1-phosphate thymidylyltransferase [Bacteroidota bacterium]TAG88913.1 MAG: glucose-1-phosphate thymidylyltransferase [Bacteroidota bacterium]